MAELEMIDHMKKAVGTFKKEHSLKEKIKEFFLEIFIIVFAVTLSIWLHGWSEDRHMMHEKEYFLKELREDILYDIGEFEKGKQNYLQKAKAFGIVADLKSGQKIDEKFLNRYQEFIYSYKVPVATVGRYESYKSSGKIGNIKDPVLQGDILDLFEEDNVNLILLVNVYKDLQENFNDYLIKTVKRTPSGNNFGEVLSGDTGVNYSFALSHTEKIVQQYDVCIKKMKKIVAGIDKELE